MKIILSTLLIFCTLAINAQSDEDFENFGRTLLLQVSDTNEYISTRFIRIREYHEFIENQPISEHQKKVAMHRINDEYNDMYMAHQESTEDLKASYAMDRTEGASFEFMNVEKEEMKGSADAFTLRVNYLYKNGKVQTIVGLIVDTAWLGDEMVAISAVKEDF